MSRLDQNPGAEKSVVAMGPPPDKVRETLANRTSEPVDLGPLTNAASYGKRVQARRMQTEAIKGHGRPLGGAPPLDPAKMQTLADALMPKPNFGVPDQPNVEEPRYPEPPAGAMPGVGSGYHINQAMARGEVDRPVSLKGAKEMAEEAKAAAAPVRKPLSQGSIEALEQVKKATETGQGVDPDAPTVADPMSDGQTTEELDKADGKVVKERDNDFDFDAINETQKMLMSPDRRKLIEGRLSPLDIEDMIVKREIQQTVVVIPGKLSYTFRTFNQSESLFCLRYVYDFPGSMIFANELLNTCKMVCSLVAVNGAMLPDHRKGLGSDKEEVDRELFEKKKHHVAGLPVQLIGDLSVNAIWFNDRVTKLFSLDNLKNG